VGPVCSIRDEPVFEKNRELSFCSTPFSGRDFPLGCGISQDQEQKFSSPIGAALRATTLDDFLTWAHCLLVLPSHFLSGNYNVQSFRACLDAGIAGKSDHASRFILLCEALESTRQDLAFTAFERLFKERGLPTAIRSDNGVPFASANALFNLSKLAVWWLRLGIAIERIKPGQPQQNGRHERMHLTLKKEATRPPGMNSLQQQAKFDTFIQEFNFERPHEALGMKRPADLYGPSPKPYRGLSEITYPFHDRNILITACGRICMHRKKINISHVLAGQTLGIKEVDEGIWRASFMHYDLGYIDLEQRTLQPLDNPFGPGLSPMS
jgi:hypothetical protein